MGAVWAIDLGKSALKAVKLRRERDVPEIEVIEHIEYRSITDSKDHSDQVQSALGELKGRHTLAGSELVVSLPGNAAFTRFIKLPPVEESKIADMVMYEARQQIPFQIEEVRWDFQKIEKLYEPGEEIEVGLFAVKNDLVRAFLLDLNAHELDAATITLAPLSIYNFFLYDQGADEPTIFLDVGAEHTELVIVDGPNFWLRNLPIAGNDFTKVLSEKFKLDFERAEDLKRTIRKRRDRKKIVAALRSVMDDFVSEVHRSIGYFRSQARGSAPKRVVILGNGSRLPTLIPYLQKKLGVEVDRFRAINRLTVGPDVDLDLLQDHLGAFGVAFGLAVQGVGYGLNQVNLVPSEVIHKRELAKKKPLVAVAVALLYLLVFSLYFIKQGQLEGLAEASTDTGRASGLQVTEMDIQQVERQFGPVEQQIQALLAATKGRAAWVESVGLLDEILPSHNGALFDPSAVEGWGDLGVDDRLNTAAEEMAELTLQKSWVLELKMLEATKDAMEKAGYFPQALSNHVHLEIMVAKPFDEELNRTYSQLNQRYRGPIKQRFGISKSIDDEAGGFTIMSLVPQERSTGSNPPYAAARYRWFYPEPPTEAPAPARPPRPGSGR